MRDAWVGRSPLHVANSVECVELLLSRGAEVNILDRDSQTPLFSAAAALPVDVTAALLAAGASVNWQDDYGETALYCACDSTNYPAAMLLLEYRADVNLAKHWVSAASSMAHSIATLWLLYSASIAPLWLLYSASIATL